MAVLGILGAFLFALGGALLFNILFEVLTRGSEFNQTGLSVFAFLGFFLVGLGLWSIVHDAKAVGQNR
jgi:Na+-transporting NADH:ubiquinone oxidoreductase subunit NqrD